MWRSPLEYSGYSLEVSLVLEHVCAGGGGGNVTFHGMQVPRERLYINIPPVPQGPSRR